MKLPDEAKRLEQQAQLIEKFLRELTEQYGEIPAVIVIGGFAVRAHGATRFSHDGDIMVDMGTYAALRDQYTVYKAERLGKSEFRTPSNIEIDVYVENQHKLRVPFDEAQAYAVKKKGLWVACVEHLLILKLDALKDRGNTDKGEKDIDDILLLLSRNEIAHPDLLKRHLRSGDWSILDEVIDTAGNWQRFTNQNYKESATLQERVIAALKAIKPSPLILNDGMILNTTDPIVGRTVSSLEIIADAGYPITTTGTETIVAVRTTREASIASWGELIHLRHHPSRQLTIFADTTKDALEVLAYEFHLWEVRESIRLAKRLRQMQTNS